MMFNKIPRTQLYIPVSDIVKSIIELIFNKPSYGLEVRKFEKAFSKYQNRDCIALPFARTALYYILKTYNFPKNSEIITTPITIVDMINMIRCSGNIPVFVDISKDFSMDVNQLKKKITKNTKAILVTHLFGNPTNMDEILKIAKKYNLRVIEDASQSMGTRYKGKLMGNFADVAIFSLSSFKTVSTFYGGLLIAKDNQLIKKIEEINSKNPLPHRLYLLKIMVKSLITSLATNKIIFSVFVYYVVKFLNFINPSIVPYLQSDNKNKRLLSEIPKEFEIKYTDIQAKLGLKYLKNLDSLNNKRKAIFQEYFKKKTESTCWRLPYLSDNPQLFMKCLFNNYVDCSQTLLSSCNIEPIFKEYHANCPNAEKTVKNMVFIPIEPTLNKKQINHVSEVIKKCMKKH